MDPHSTHSQFNQRAPKSGPYTPATRFTDQPQKIAIERYAKPPPTAKNADLVLALVQRPIATNARVRQGEQFKRDMFVAFINKALQEKLDGLSKDFDDLVDQFNSRRATESTTASSHLRLWILALSHVLSKLEKRHAALVEAVVDLPWTTMDAAFVKSYTVFVGMLLSARPEYLSLVLCTIAQGMTYQSGLQALDAGGPESSASPLTRSVVYDRLHHLLRHLLSLIPTLPSTLQPLLVRHFPHKRQSQATQVTYIRNLLRIAEYCSELADRILALIIDRALQIDVEIQVELEELEQDDTLESSDLFEFDPFDVVVGQEGFDDGSDGGSSDAADSDDLSSDGDSDSDSEPDLPIDLHHMRDMVDKLDHVLKLVFDHLDRVHHLADPHGDTPPPSPDTIRAIRTTQFHALLGVFDRAIVRTFKSRYTQFLVFWYASLDPEFSDLFQGLLVEKALIGGDVPTVTRAAAASYIASFVSRATFVDRAGARRAMGVLCGFLGAHLDALERVVEAGQGTPGMTHHSVFYAVAQAVFLVFCFRWRDLEDEAGQGGRRWMTELDVVQRAITSPLNPLKVCAPTVVMQFARVARATDFVYCHSIIEANRRSEYDLGRSPAATMLPGNRAELASAELHTFFPFDPYKLPRSGSYIQGAYREWSTVAIGDDDDESDEEGGEEGEEGDGASEAVGTLSVDVEASGLQIPQTTSGSGPDGLGESFGEMSISPAHPMSVVTSS